jgi:hypothetical protein
MRCCRVGECTRKIEKLRDACPIPVPAVAATPDSASDLEAGQQRKLLNLFSSVEEEQPITQIHCCATDNSLPGCEANNDLAESDPDLRIGLLPVKSSNVQRPLFTRDMVAIGNYEREDRLFCIMERLKRTTSKNAPKTDKNWLGAQKWRWLIQVALYAPLGPVAFGIASIFSHIVTTFHIGGRNVCPAPSILSCSSISVCYTIRQFD